MANGCTKETIDTMSALMSQGFTQDEVCAACDVSDQSFRNWRNKQGPHYDKDFAEAFDRAKRNQKAVWMKRGRDNIGEGRDFNTALFSLYMINMFPEWRTGGSRDDEALREIRKLKEQLGVEDS